MYETQSSLPYKRREPDLAVGVCPTQGQRKYGDPVAHKSERTGKRFISVAPTTREETSYPLPAVEALLREDR